MIRMMAPDGTLGNVPDEHVSAAVEAGGRVMTSADLKQMYQNLFMQHVMFKDKQAKVRKSFETRRLSLRARTRAKQ